MIAGDVLILLSPDSSLRLIERSAGAPLRISPPEILLPTLGIAWGKFSLECEEFNDSRDDERERLQRGVVGFSRVLLARVRDLLAETLVVEPRGSVDVFRGSLSPVAGFKQLLSSLEPVLRSPEIDVPLVLGFINPLGLGLSPVELWRERGVGMSETSAFEALFLRGRVP